MRRPVIGSLAVAAAATVGLLALTGAAGQLGLLVLIPGMGLVGLVAHRWRADGGSDTAWSAPARLPAIEAGVAGAGAGAGAGVQDTVGGGMAGFGARAPATPTAVARALGRVEARELLRSPWFGTGLGLTLVPFLALVVLWGGENGVSRDEFALLTPWLVHPLVGMLVVAAHRSATRARRDGLLELIEACPTAAATRTAGLLQAAWVGFVVPLGFLALYAVGLYLRSPDLWGAPGLDAGPVVLAAAALGVGAVALGAALADGCRTCWRRCSPSSASGWCRCGSTPRATRGGTGGRCWRRHRRCPIPIPASSTSTRGRTWRGSPGSWSSSAP